MTDDEGVAVSLVIDASVSLKWVLDEVGSQAAEALLTEELIAPDLMLVEAANALWRHILRGEMTLEEGKQRLAELNRAPVAITAGRDDLPAALDLANRLRHPVYDCLYLALALRKGAQVVTADRRFQAACDQAPSVAGVVRLLE